MTRACFALRLIAATLVLGIVTPIAAAQPPAAPPAAAPQGGRGGAARPPAVASPEVLPDGRVTFRIFAPRAESVVLNAGDIPAAGPAPAFVKAENGVWEMTLGPVVAGAFRYVFVVDGVRTLDPVNTKVSESNTAAWSLFHVPGAQVQDVQSVPHGAIAEVYYESAVLKTTRRMHVYTPPGYESGKQKYPVFYLLHGAGDTDDAWTSVGRAGFIIDNLIAAGKVTPMIVVMPAGHQPASAGTPAAAAPGPGRATGQPAAINPFTREFVTDVMPYVERHYRTIADREHRAIAGLSMGGSQTLDIAFRHLARFAYIGVFSSGASLGGGRGAAAAPGAAPAPPPPDWAAVRAADLGNASLKKGTRLIWLSTGAEDRLMPNTKSTVDMLRQHGFAPEVVESPGGHTWLNWRDYLVAFAPRLFRPAGRPR